MVWAGFAGRFLATSGLTPAALDAAAVWVALLGALSNFVWAVQSWSVPVFYGRRPPNAAQLGPPC